MPERKIEELRLARQRTPFGMIFERENCQRHPVEPSIRRSRRLPVNVEISLIEVRKRFR
jgi:hypothetical protein